MNTELSELAESGIEGGSSEEARLVEACRQGDAPAFNLLVWRWEKPLYNFVYKYVGHADTAEDLVQETFVRVLKHIGRYTHRGSFSTWLYRIAINLCKDHLKKKRLPTVSLHDCRTTASGEKVYVKDRVAGDGPPADAAADAEDVGETVRRLLSGLPEEQRVVILMKEYQEMTFREIAEVLEVPEGTLKSRLYHGLRAMRSQLERLGIEGPTGGGSR
ncbi:MAG: RNA polymerase sigma factor [bacterium]